MDVSAANTPKAAHTRPTGPARPAASVTPNRSNVAGSYSDGVTKTEMAVILATRMTGVLRWDELGQIDRQTDKNARQEDAEIK